MSLHWTLIAGFLYAEIVAVLLMVLPFLRPSLWNRLFRSKFLKGIEHQLIYYFYVLVAILVLFFLDAIREMRKYGDDHAASEAEHANQHLDAQMQTHMRLFRAQRNFYISGFALFLCLVIRRLVGLITANAALQAEKEAAIKQASSASRAAEALMSDEKGENVAVKRLEGELKKAQDDLQAMKEQAEGVTKEYDRLMEEKDKLERQLKMGGGQAVSAGGDKKGD